MANRHRATLRNVIKEVNRSPARKFRLYMYALIMSCTVTLAVMKANSERAANSRNEPMLTEELGSSILINDSQISELHSTLTGDTGLFEIIFDLEGLEGLETFEWPMEDYGVEVPVDCHVPPDFTQPELQEACVHWDVPKSECDQFLRFAWETSADFVHPALGLRPGCLD